MDVPAISARSLTKRFGKTVALDGFDLEVPKGSVVGLLGPAGAGKSTVVRLLAGLARPNGGSVSIGGTEARAGEGIAARRRLGVVLPEPGLPGWMTVRELLAFLAGLSEVPAIDVPARIDAVAAQLSIGGAVLDRKLGDLPAPTVGRIGIAQALIADPAVLVLDEPFHLLDPEARSEVRGLLRDIAKRTTILLATHRLADVEGLCDRVALLVAGRRRAYAPIDQFLARFAPPVYVADVDAHEGLALEGLVARLRAESWVEEAVVLGGALRVSASDHLRAERELLPAVVATGLRVGGFRRARPSLDAIVAELGDGPSS